MKLTQLRDELVARGYHPAAASKKARHYPWPIDLVNPDRRPMGYVWVVGTDRLRFSPRRLACDLLGC